MLFALAKSYLTSSLFTITYYLQKIPRWERKVKSEEVKKYPRNKSEEFFGCGKMDSVPRDLRARSSAALDSPPDYQFTTASPSNPIPEHKKRDITSVISLFLAAELGFEPRQTESESAVLPLHNSASTRYIIAKTYLFVNSFLNLFYSIF